MAAKPPVKMSLKEAYMSATAPAPKPTKAQPVDDESIKDKIADVISKAANAPLDIVRKAVGEELTGRLQSKENAKEIAEFMLAPVPKIVSELKQGNTFPNTRKAVGDIIKLFGLFPWYIPSNIIPPMPSKKPPRLT